MTKSPLTAPTTPVPMAGFEETQFRTRNHYLSLPRKATPRKYYFNPWLSTGMVQVENGSEVFTSLEIVVAGQTTSVSDWSGVNQDTPNHLAAHDLYTLSTGQMLDERPPCPTAMICGAATVLEVGFLKMQAAGDQTRGVLPWIALSDTAEIANRATEWIVFKNLVSAAYGKYRATAEVDSGLFVSVWARLESRLASLGNLKDGWDSYSAPAPTPESIQTSIAFLGFLRTQATAPNRVAPTVVGGVGFTFLGSGRRVYVEFSNKGSILVLFSDDAEEPQVEKVEQRGSWHQTLIGRIKKYLHE